MDSKVFLDTDIIIDFLIDRQPHANAATQILDMAEKKHIVVCSSVLSFNNIHYIVRKFLGEIKTREVISELIEVIEVLGVEKEHLIQAINSDFKDFKDALQHATALSDTSIKAIITRNTKDYKTSKVPIFSSEDYIKLMRLNK